jgi:hypothetical protein
MAELAPEAAETVTRTRTRPPRRQGYQRLPPAGPVGGQPRGGQRRQRQASGYGRSTARTISRARLPGSHSYQPVILAEFLVAVVVVAVTPLANGGTSTAQAKNSPSPYSVDTIKQLVAIGVVYFVLALLAASQRTGRYSAWFGGLVLIALGLYEVKSGGLANFFKAFSPPAVATNTEVT